MVERSGFLKLPFEQGDSVMADKGFTIEDVLPLGVSLNIPPFLGMSDQMNKFNLKWLKKKHTQLNFDHKNLQIACRLLSKSETSSANP